MTTEYDISWVMQLSRIEIVRLNYQSGPSKKSRFQKQTIQRIFLTFNNPVNFTLKLTSKKILNFLLPFPEKLKFFSPNSDLINWEKITKKKRRKKNFFCALHSFLFFLLFTLSLWNIFVSIFYRWEKFHCYLNM